VLLSTGSWEMGQYTRMLRQTLRAEGARGGPPGQAAHRLHEPRRFRAPASGALILVCVLLVFAFLIRLDGITTPSVESRELHNALIARQFFYGDGAAAAGFRLAGGEELWIPRLVSSALWSFGGVFLYLIAGRLMTRLGAVVAVGLYLFWPHGAFISRLYMPDAVMLTLLLAGALAVIRYWERPSSGRLLAAGVVSGAATVAKPGLRSSSSWRPSARALFLAGRAPRSRKVASRW
jgi:hypothetical protein